MKLNHRRRGGNRGAALIIAMVFVMLFSTLAISLSTLASTNAQVAGNQHKVNTALYAAQSGLECAKLIATTVSLDSTSSNVVSVTDAEDAWNDFRAHVGDIMLDGKSLETNTEEEVITQSINFGGNAAFRLRFYRDSNEPRTIMLESTGSSSNVTRKISMDMGISKDNSLLHFAIASKTRVWITGNSTIHGNIYSSWKYQNIAPFNITSDSKVEGSINTVLTNTNPDTGQLGDDLYADTTEVPYDLETLTADGKPKYNVLSEAVYDEAGNAVSVVTGDYTPLFDSEGNRVYDGSGNLVYNIAGATDLYGNPLYDGEGNPVNIVYGDKVVSASDELQGQYDRVNYGQDEYGNDLPDSSSMYGMDISDYDTSEYKNLTTTISDDVYDTTTNTYYSYYLHQWVTETVPAQVTEYFPHAAGDYATPASWSSLELDRYVCTGKTLTNIRVPSNKHVLFKGCDFEGILYVENESGANNIRFEDCTFNGPIVTTPSTDTSSGWWQRNQLYFTGAATFNNQSEYQEATILAPHFNVNLGNTNPEQSDNNVLTGAIVGGIVDIRGNAQIYGTIISMFDTSSYSSGYVSNIGATEDDGGSETTEAGDIGVIDITPNADQMLPSGIMSPIIVVPNMGTYNEGV